MSGLNIRGFGYFQGIVQPASGVSLVSVAAPEFILKHGDTVLFVDEVSSGNSGNDFTAFFNASPLIVTSVSIPGGTYFLIQNAQPGNDFSARRFRATFGVGPTG